MNEELNTDDLEKELEASTMMEAEGSSSMTSRAYSKLREDIMTGALEPGMKLKIEALRRRYDIGTSPIHEALSLLTSDNFVERIDQRGFRVAEISATEFEELLKTRCWLEARAIKESVKNGSNNLDISFTSIKAPVLVILT